MAEYVREIKISLRKGVIEKKKEKKKGAAFCQRQNIAASTPSNGVVVLVAIPSGSLDV